MKQEQQIEGVLVNELKVFKDSRGHFLEGWNQRDHGALGIHDRFVQDNLSYSKKGVLRGLHFQSPQSQSKLIQVISGEIFDVLLDVRVGSPSYGATQTFVLSSDDFKQIYIPSGIAHGFLTLSNSAIFSYKCSNYYDPCGEYTVRWDDVELSINWPINDPLVSEKDKKGFFFKEVPDEILPRYSIDGNL